MSAQIINGNRIAKQFREQIAQRTQQLCAAGGRAPGLAVILVGDDPASHVYVSHKEKDCAQVGFKSEIIRMPADTSQATLEEAIAEFNGRANIDGLLVQVPLPEHMQAQRIVELIDPSKDVDGFHPYNLGRLAIRQPALRPCTARGVMALLESTGLRIRGLDATIIGASNHVGRPMGLELLLAGCTVTTAHKFSKDLAANVSRADILVSAVGKPGLIKGEWIKPGAIVIDVGITRDEQGKLNGDIEFAEAQKRAAWITPVPGGVGPMTRIGLLLNTLQVAAQTQGLPDIAL